jgi:hypothetical protein
MNDRPSTVPFNWKTIVAQARADADAAPAGQVRDKLLERAAQLEISAHTEGWLNASDLRPPSER